MADAAAIETPATEVPPESATEVDMEVEKANGGAKREREEEADEGGEEGGNLKKARTERSVEEERLENEKTEEAQGVEGGNEIEEEEEGEQEVKEVKLGPKVFTKAENMFNYFFELLHYWGPGVDINQYEHMVLIDLIKKGHSEPERKIGKGVEAFEVRNHPVYRSRCFFVRRIDGSADDFSFRKCVDAIMPLPDEMKIKPSGDGNRFRGGRGGVGRGGRGGRGGRRGRGRGRG